MYTCMRENTMQPEIDVRPPLKKTWVRPSTLKWAALSGLVFFAVLEIVLRVAFGFGNPLLLEKDPDAGYCYKSNQAIFRFGKYTKINQYHQRNDDILDLPERGVCRVMFIGDSVTFGGTV